MIPDIPGLLISQQSGKISYNQYSKNQIRMALFAHALVPIIAGTLGWS
jgi:hypothetical protein